MFKEWEEFEKESIISKIKFKIFKMRFEIMIYFQILKNITYIYKVSKFNPIGLNELYFISKKVAHNFLGYLFYDFNLSLKDGIKICTHHFSLNRDINRAILFFSYCVTYNSLKYNFKHNIYDVADELSKNLNAPRYMCIGCNFIDLKDKEYGLQ